MSPTKGPEHNLQDFIASGQSMTECKIETEISLLWRLQGNFPSDSYHKKYMSDLWQILLRNQWYIFYLHLLFQGPVRFKDNSRLGNVLINQIIGEYNEPWWSEWRCCQGRRSCVWGSTPGWPGPSTWRSVTPSRGLTTGPSLLRTGHTRG